MKVKQIKLENRNEIETLTSEMDSSSTVLFCFMSSRLTNSKEMIQTLKAKFPQSLILGCSGAGEVMGDQVVDQSLVVTITQFEKATVELHKIELADISSGQKSGQNLMQKISKDVKAVLVFSEGLNINGTQFVQGLAKSLPQATVLAGGLAGDGTKFENTFVVYQGEILNNSAVALGLSGGLKVKSIAQGGWAEFGPKRKITQSKNNVVSEIDGSPALKLYEDFLGEQSKELPAAGLMFPLALKRPGHLQGEPIVRTLLNIDREKKTLTFAGDIPEGAEVRFMRSTYGDLANAAESAANLSMKDFNDKNPVLGLAISCVGRRLLMGEYIENELEVITAKLPKNSALMGFYSYGEIGSDGIQTCDLHNQTMCLTLIQEDA